MTYVIAGLGNPGDEYKNTRHNTGRIILEMVRKNLGGFSDWKLDSKNKISTSSGSLEGKKIVMAMPESFMNNSGGPLKSLITNAKEAERLVIIHDDLDLPMGASKISFNRGFGGHRGVGSIIKNLKTEAFLRIRVGISPETPSHKLKKPKGEAAVQKFILGEFKKPEMEILKKIAKRAAEAANILLTDGREKATSIYNAG